jgi:hypothetical protein
MMGTALLLAMRGIGMRLITAFASKKLLEWLLFWAVDLIVKSTKTDKDDELVRQIKVAYYGEINEDAR